MAVLVTLIGSTANADIVIDDTAIVIDNKTIPTSDIVSMRISNGILNINVKGWTVKQDVSTPGGVVVNLTATPSSIDTGQSVTLDWSTTNADSCVASDAWVGNRSTSGREIVTPTAAGTYTFTLRCINSTTNAEDWVKVTVSDPVSGPTNCSQPPLSGGRVITWSSFFGQNFPGPNNADIKVNIDRHSYLAIEFNSGDLRRHGAIGLIQTTTSSGLRRGSISECPGDFTGKNIEACKTTWGVDELIKWGMIDHPVFCQLDTNKTYYVNFTFTDGKEASSTTCPSGTCLIRITSHFGILP